MQFSLDEVDSSWHPIFARHLTELNEILSGLSAGDFTPTRGEIFRAFTIPKNAVKVVIFGQDPYPGAGIADGLAFSSHAGNPIPASLRNIYIEFASDLNLPIPQSPDLSKWALQGVLLLNRSLTTIVGERNAHLRKGWLTFTENIARELAANDVVAILWGNFARELSDIFEYKIESAHPSPLAARRGFFGSKPFSRANELLGNLEREAVDWTL